MANGAIPNPINPYGLSDQDVGDLQQIQSQLQPSDPRYGKITALLATRPTPSQMARQALSTSGISGPQLESAATSPWTNPIPMQQSLAPRVVRGVATALPFAAGWGGGIVGAGAGGIGAVGGAGVGAMAGEEARQAINQGLALPTNDPRLNMQYEGEPLSAEESAKRIALAGTLGAGSELGGGLLIGAGGRVLSRVAAAQAAKETGTALTGLTEAAPIAFSAKGVQRSIDSAFDAASARLSPILQGAQGTASLSQTMAPLAQRAAQSQVKGVAGRFDKIIAAAKEVAGIQGDQVTADQMFNFARAMVKPNVYTQNLPGPIKAVLDNILKDAYGQAGTAVRSLAPEAAEPLQQLTNLHAARSAIQAYQPGVSGSALISAATHPATTAALSPAITIGASQAPSPWRVVRQVGAEFLP